MSIKYIAGDATNPVGKGPKIIAHIVNTEGVFAAGFVLALSKKWPETRDKYLKWHAKGPSFKLGNVQFIKVAEDLYVASMLAQVLDWDSGPPIRYEALEKCLAKVAKKAATLGASIVGPRFGAALAGGSWDKIEPIIEKTCKGIKVTIYDFDGPGAMKPQLTS